MNDQLKQLIQYAKSENWEEMDALIPVVCNQSDVIEWSLQEGVKDKDANVRDLAVSILEKSEYLLEENDVALLTDLMNRDENVYVQFRAAFTLFNRGELTKEVLEKMHDALLDSDVKEIAQNYLDN